VVRDDAVHQGVERGIELTAGTEPPAGVQVRGLVVVADGPNLGRISGVTRVPRPLRPTLLAFRERLEARFPGRLEELLLFGSWARGDQTEESDVDVMVAVRGLTTRERDEVYRIASETDDANNTVLLLLAPLAYSSEQVLKLRRGGRRLFRDIDAEGVAF